MPEVQDGIYEKKLTGSAMFGYICINQPELKVKDYEAYRGYYCGLCHELKKRYGRIGQMLLSYDMTFLVILLTGLYEPEESREYHRCIPHPVRKHMQIQNEITGYAADMNVLLSYRKALDDWKDEGSRRGRALAASLKRNYNKLQDRYPRQAGSLEESLELLSEAEKTFSEDIDYVAGLSGRFLGEMFAWKEDEWQRELYDMGFFLGKFIYLMDAWEDMEKDQKKGNYNIFLLRKKMKPEHFAEDAETILVDMMSQCSGTFERLPVLYRADILRNILYSGVWGRYCTVQERRKKEEKDERSI